MVAMTCQPKAHDGHHWVARVTFADGRPTIIKRMERGMEPYLISGLMLDAPIGTAFGSSLEIWWHCPAAGAVRIYPDPDFAAIETLKAIHTEKHHAVP